MSFWFGRLGALSALPGVLPGMTPTPVRQSTTEPTVGGGQQVSFAPGPGRRVFRAGWNHLDPDQRTALVEYFAGLRGPGPFVLIDPAQRNHLSANQSGATSASMDGTGFTVDPSEAVTSNPAAFLRGPRSARWTLPATVVSGVLELDPPAGLVGVPAPPGQPWTFTGSLSLTGVAASVTVTPVLSWRRIDGSEVATTAGTPVAAVPGGWAAFAATAAAPPAAAVAVRAQLRVTPAVLTTAGVGVDVAGGSPVPAAVPVGRSYEFAATGPRILVAAGPAARAAAAVLIERPMVSTTDVLLDQPQLDMFNGIRAWVAGTGVPQVSFVDLSPVYDTFAPYASLAATFVEVA